MFQNFGFKKVSASKDIDPVVCFLAGYVEFCAIHHMRGYIARIQKCSGTTYIWERVCSAEIHLLIPVLPFELHLTFGKSLNAEPQIT